MTNTPDPQADERRDRYAQALREAGDTAYGNSPFYEAITNAVIAVADAEQAELRRERDLAIAHDRQPYPTAWAYEQACKALHRKTDLLDRVRAVAEAWARPTMSEPSRVAGQHLLRVLDGDAVPAVEATTRAALREQIAETLARADGWEYGSGLGLRDMAPSTVEHYDKLADAVLAVLSPATDRAALVQRVAAALTEHDLVHLADPDLPDEYACCAEAVLAVLHAPADRAALSAGQREMLGYALDLVEQRNFSRSGRLTDDDRVVLAGLRRMADEAQPAETHLPTEPFAGDTRRCFACGHTMDSHIRVNGEIACAFEDCTDPTAERPVVGEQPDTQTQTPAVPCSAVALRVHHAPHGWEPQPGMDPVRCNGYPERGPFGSPS
ncbi:hypothetical protein [Streptomyces sp. NPDC002088]|uniref:hypothetical protein n=1 Tax=Streptomyces sp. NPDC002088 TaxID=3154665 RepID=UPI003316A4E3